MPNRPAARPLALLLPLLLLPAPSRLVAQEPAAPASHRVESVGLRPTAAGGAELVIVSSTELGLVGVRADPRGGLFLQLPQHSLGPAVEALLPRSGLVSAVECTVDRTSRGPLARITVTTRRPVAHTLSTAGRRLSLRLRGVDEEPEEVALRRQTEELRSSLAASEQARVELSGRVEALVAENRELAQSFETLEARRSDLDGTLKATLGEVTEMLRGLSARTEELNQELRQAEGREEGLRQQVARLESELEASASAGRPETAGASRETDEKLARLEEERVSLRRDIRAREARVEELEAALETQQAELARLEEESLALATKMSERLEAATAREDDLRSQLEGLAAALADARELERPPNVELEKGLGDDLPVRGLTVSEGRRGEPRGGQPPRVAAPGTGPDVTAPGDLFFIVVATETEEPLAASFASGLRAKGYPSEVYWSDSGYFVVTLDRLPADPARQKRDQAVAAGDVPADSYLIPGSTLRKPSP